MGVTQPCQRLYIKYFEQTVSKFNELPPRILSLNKIVFSGGYNLHNIYIKIKDVIKESYILNTHKK